MIHLNPADYHIARIRKSDNMFQSKLDFKDTKFLIKIRYIHKLKKRRASELAFLVIKINKIPTLYLTFKKHVNLLSLKRKDKKHYVLIKDFITFMYNHSLHREKKHFRHYCLPDFSMEKN